MNKRIKHKIGAILLSGVMAFSVFAEAPLTVVSYAAEADIAVNETNFPDATFRSYILNNIDSNDDNALSQSEINGVTEVSLNFKSITSLKGIEYFTALKTLSCKGNSLTSLDVSKNTALKELNCYYNELSVLDVSKNTALKILDCSDNLLSELDVSKNTALVNLRCAGNKLTTLDVSKNTSLVYLSCSYNKLSALDVSYNTALIDLICEYNQLSKLDISKNAALENLWCGNNKLSQLDVSKNTALVNLSCTTNKLTTLDISKNTVLAHLECENNQLTKLDVSKNAELFELRCSNNNLTSLDVSNNSSLGNVLCYNNSYELAGTSLAPLAANGFDGAKASNWTNATYDAKTNSLTNIASDTVTYAYDIGKDKTAYFTLKLVSDTQVKIVNILTGTEKITVSWSAVEGATKYRIRRRVDNGQWVDYKDVTSTSFVDTNVEIFKNYYYAVYAYVDGEWSDVSPIVSGKLISVAAVQNLKAATSDSKITLTWDTVSGATTYRIRRNDGTGWVDYKDVTTASFVDANVTPEAKYSYAVYARSDNLLWSGPSNIVHIIAKALPVVQNVKAVGDTEKITLTWRAVEGATKYRVRRKVGEANWIDYKDVTSASFVDTNVEILGSYYYAVYAYINGKWSGASAIVSAKLTAVSAVQNLKAVAGDSKITLTWDAVPGATEYRIRRKDGEWKDYKATTSTSFVDTNVTRGAQYSYAVYARSDNHLWSSASNIVTVVANGAPIVQNVKAVAGNNKITLTWDAVAGATMYRIHRKSGSTEWAKYKELTENSYIDTAVTNGTKYYYAVYSYVNGEWSNSSDIVNAAPTVPAVQNVKAAAGDSKVTITWDAVAGATKYRIHRKIGSAEWANYKELTETSYIDTAVTNGTKYSYAVYSYVNGVWSGASATVSATPAVSTAQNVKAVAGDSKVTVTWNAVAGATKYRIRKKIDGGNWKDCPDVTTTSFTDTDVIGGTKYYYAVYSYVNNGWHGPSDIVSAIPTAAVDLVAINATNFPDKTFRSYILDSFDRDGNKILSQSEADRVQYLYLDEQNITTLKGIEYFAKLKYLECRLNPITSLDLSKNTALCTLYCNDNQLRELIIGKNTTIDTILCYNNQLTELDVSGNTALTELWCTDNYLTKLDVSDAATLKVLYCNNNQLSELDLSSNIALKNLSCSNNQLSELDLSNNTALNYVDCEYNQLSELDFSNNTAVTAIYCSYNKLTTLNVSKCTALDELECGYNLLTKLDVSKNTALEYLQGNNNNLTSLDLSYHTNLGGGTASNNTYNLEGTSLDPLVANGFDGTRASNWTGATYDPDTNSLIDITSDTVTYIYDVGRKSFTTMQVTLHLTPDTQPKNLKATADADKVTLTWDAVANATKYRIRRNDGTQWVDYKDLTETTCTDTEIFSRSTYHYAVYAYVNGKWSKSSEVVRVVIPE